MFMCYLLDVIDEDGAEGCRDAEGIEPIYIYIYIDIFIHLFIYVCVCIYIYIYVTCLR